MRADNQAGDTAWPGRQSHVQVYRCPGGGDYELLCRVARLGERDQVIARRSELGREGEEPAPDGRGRKGRAQRRPAAGQAGPRRSRRVPGRVTRAALELADRARVGRVRPRHGDVVRRVHEGSGHDAHVHPGRVGRRDLSAYGHVLAGGRRRRGRLCRGGGSRRLRGRTRG